MSSKILIAEPHPTVQAGNYTHAGRGGAGNTFRVSSSGTSSSSRPVKVSRSSGKKFYSGIGGAGNVHGADERAALNLGEEFDRARVRDSAPAGHVGVGGAGNVYRKHRAGPSESTGSPRTSHESQSSSAGFWGRISTSSHRH